MEDNILESSVSMIKGIGRETTEKLNEIGIYSINDLLGYFPFRYEDTRIREVFQATHNEKITVTGTVQTVVMSNFYGKKSRLTFKMQTGNYLIAVVVFNQNYLKNKLPIGQEIVVSGKWDRNRQMITASSVKLSENFKSSGFEPVYHAKNDIAVNSLRKWIDQALVLSRGRIKDTLPESIRTKYRLAEREKALWYLHFPKNEAEVKQARRRFVYEEFLSFQLKMQSLRKFQRENVGGCAKPFDDTVVSEFTASLPFELTNAQKRAVEEVLGELKSPYRMNRLLQGDVGSGKTVVAGIAALAAINAGWQSAIMAPTEILAEQHFESFSKMFGERAKVALLTSSVKGKKRKELLEQIESGEIHFIVGTHSLIQKDVNFHRLGFVVTDEQHRFGVEQRRILREKGENADVLFMTATPIPRTLAITVFGEMDVSVMNEMPKGRKEIETQWIRNNQINAMLGFMHGEIKKGRQAYVICPLIEESEKMDFENAVDVHAQLTNYFGNSVNVGLLHGRLTSGEKDEIMRKFAVNNIQVLVSTTVVEVGLNVPNSTFMMIYDAERFGLSQLHQLRGRVGRGKHQSYCVLVADPKSEVGVERLTAMTETNDGFELSERDLKLRGPGDFFGKKQSGVPEFKIGDMVHDINILEVARDDAAKLINSEFFWQDDSYAMLRNGIEESGIVEGQKLD